MDRRTFIRSTVGIGLAVAGGSALAACKPLSADYGALLAPNADGLRLPPGFSSRTVAITGEQVGTTGFVWHAQPDGGACFDTGDGGWIYVSNSETTPGGASMIRFDAGGDIVDARTILSGTTRNCAGGPTPWGTWLSCEETGDGQVWECDPYGVTAAVPRPGLGRFNHEAAAVETVGQCIYLTEDQPDGGLYRFVPTVYPDLSAGELQVMTEDAGVVGWEVVPDPSGDPVATRDQVPTMKTFSGGEGIWTRSDMVYFVTKWDNRVWAYLPSAGALGVLYDDDTSTTPVLVGVDNVTMPPAPGPNHVFVAEDGGNMELVAVEVGSAGEKAHVFCRVDGRAGSEITGPAFSPDGTRLYLSSQRTPGETFEVTGPFLTL